MRKIIVNWSLALILASLVFSKAIFPLKVGGFDATIKKTGVERTKGYQGAVLASAMLESQNNPNSPLWSDWRENWKNIATPFITSKAEEYGVDLELVFWIITKESNWDYRAVGDNSDSIGLWQFNLAKNPDISYECAADVICSTDLAMKWLLEGKKNRWSVVKFCSAWFPDCPFKKLIVEK